LRREIEAVPALFIGIGFIKARIPNAYLKNTSQKDFVSLINSKMHCNNFMND
jgi:hypothetical protein